MMNEHTYIVVIVAITISLNVSIVYGESRIAYMLAVLFCNFITKVKFSQSLH